MSLPYKAMILAAGLGQRMRPLTNSTPKPLLRIGDAALIEYHLTRLRAMGVREVVINVSYLAEQIIAFLAGGERYGLSIEYSIEDQGPLGVMAGLLQALPLLGDQPFLLFSADVWFQSEFPEALLTRNDYSHVVLSAHSELGAFFGLNENNQLTTTGVLMDYAGIAKLNPQHIKQYYRDKLADFIYQLIQAQLVRGSLLSGQWFNVGTPEDLQAVRNYFARAES